MPYQAKGISYFYNNFSQTDLRRNTNITPGKAMDSRPNGSFRPLANLPARAGILLLGFVLATVISGFGPAPALTSASELTSAQALASTPALAPTPVPTSTPALTSAPALASTPELASESTISQTFDTPGEHTFTVPQGVTEITLKLWGAGGAGGAGFRQGQTNRSGGGGGGGAFRTETISVTPGETISITVGAGGTPVSGSGNSGEGGGSSVLEYDGLTLTASGGDGGENATSGDRGSSGAGGSGATDGTFHGGDGADGTQNGGGGGGSSAGTASDGQHADGTTGGAAVAEGGGGGDGATEAGADGSPGSTPGGGGGGGRGNNGLGAAGADGQVILTYTSDEPTPQYTLTLDINGEGSVEVDGVPYTDPVTVNEGTTLTLEAIPANDYVFSNWTESETLLSENTSLNVTVDEDRSIAANFVPEPAPGVNLRLQYKNDSRDASSQNISPHLILHNDGDQELEFSKITIRYWFVSEPEGKDVYAIDWAEVGDENVFGDFGVAGGQRYVEIGFTEDAEIPGWMGGEGPNVFPPGANSGTINNRIHDDGWGYYDQSNDYSWDPSFTDYADYEYITVYYEGSLVWGTPPSGAADPEQMTIVQQPEESVASETLDPAPAVLLEDALGRPVENVDVEVSLNQNNFTGGSTVIVTTDANGLATFDNLRIVTAADDYQITFSPDASLLNSQSSESFDVVAAEPADMSITTQPPETATAGEPLDPAPSVSIHDAFGNPVPDTEVAASINQNDFDASSTTSVFTNASGVAMFDQLVITQAASHYTIAFSTPASDLENLTSSEFTIIPAAASEMIMETQPEESVSGGNIAGPPRVKVTDAFQNPVQGVVVTVSETGGYEFDEGTLTRSTNNSGIAAFSDLVISTAGENYQLSFTADASGVDEINSEPFDVVEGAASMSIIAQPPSLLSAGETIDPPVSVELREDATGDPIGGVSITVSLNENNFSSGSLEAVTDASGTAVFDDLVIETAGQGYEITFNAALSGVANVFSDPFDVLAGDPAILTMHNQPGRTTAGEAIAGPPRVRITDEFGNRLPDVEISVSETGGYSFDSGTLTQSSNSEGIAIFDDLVINTAATGYRLSFSAVGTDADTLLSESFNVTAAAPHTMEIDTQPSDNQAGKEIDPPPAVILKDAYDNPVPNADVTAGLNKNNFAGGSTTIVSTNEEGLAIFDNLRINVVEAGYRMIFNSSGLDPVESDLFDIIPPDPDFGSIRLEYRAMETDPNTNSINFGVMLYNESGTDLQLSDLTVRYWFTSEHQNDNYVPDWVAMDDNNKVFGNFHEEAGEYYAELGFTDNIVIPVGFGGDGSTPDLFPDDSYTGEIEGRIHDSNWRNYDQANDYSWDPDITEYTEYQRINVYYKGELIWGVPPAQVEGGTALAFDQQPANTVAGEMISPPVTVNILDRNGEPVTHDNETTVTLSIANDPTGTASLNGTTTVVAENGVAVFDDLSIDQTGDGFTLEATATDMDAAVSTPFDIRTIFLDQITLEAEPENPVAGEQAILTAIVLYESNPVPGAELIFARISGDGSLSQSTVTTNSSGQASVTYTTSTNVETATIRAESTEKPEVFAEAEVTSVPGDPSKLSFATQPSNTSPEETVTPPVEIRVEDQYGNLVEDATNEITIAIEDNPSGGSLAGTLTVNAVDGIASFDDLSIDQQGNGYTLKATSDGLESVTSNPFHIESGIPAKLEFITQPTSTTAGESITPAVQVRILDTDGNQVETADNPVTIALGNNPEGGSLSGDLTRQAVDGIATFDNLSIDKAGENYTISASSPELATAESDPFEITPAAASNLDIVVQPTETTAGNSISPAPRVFLSDPFGNPVAGVSISVSLNQHGFSAGNTTAVTDASGEADFDDLVIETAASGYELTFSADAADTEDVTSDAFNVVAAAAAELSVITQPQLSVSGAFITGPPTVLVTDPFSNPVAGSGVSVTLNKNNFESGTTLVFSDQDGKAVFADLVIIEDDSDYALIFSADGPDDVTSDFFDVIDERVISGTILDENGTPVEGVEVVATGDLSQTTQTSSSGVYQFTGIGSGTRNITVTPSFPGYEFYPASRQISNNFSGNPVVTGEDFEARPSPATYYSRMSGPWNLKETWSVSDHEGEAAPRPPYEVDQIIIGNNHIVELKDPVSVSASVTIEDSGTLVTGPNIITGEGAFSLNTGGTLQIGDPAGISATGSTGNIRTEERHFSTEANYTYNRSGGPQQTGSGLPHTVNNLTISNSSGVTAGHDLRVEGELMLSRGTFVMPSGGSLVTNSVIGSGNVRMQHEITGDKGWRMVASPVGTIYNDLFQGFITQGFSGSDYPGLQPNILWFDETKLGTTNMAWRTPASSGQEVEAGRGHFQYVFNGAGRPDGGNYDDELPLTMKAAGQEYMTGSGFDFGITYTPRTNGNQEGIDIPEMNTGWNLVGNPTTASLDWDASQGWTKTNLDDAYYVWIPGANDGAGEFRVWNAVVSSVEDPDYVPDLDNGGLIAPFQAFWVRAHDENPQLSMTHEVKTTGATFEQKAGNTNSHTPPVVLPIKVSADNMTARTYVSFSEEGRKGEDPHDAYLLEPLNDRWLKLYTTTSEQNSPPVVNNLPSDFKNTLRIPLHIEGQNQQASLSGNHHLEWSLPSAWPADWGIVLMDHKEERAIPMHRENSYVFSESTRKSNTVPIDQHAHAPNLPENIVAQMEQPMAKTSGKPNRFTLVITPEHVDEDPVYSADEPRLLPPSPNPVRVSTEIGFSLPDADEVSIKVYDIHGRLIRELTNQNYPAGHNQITWTPGNIRAGIYLLVMESGQVRETKKVTISR